MMVLFYSHQVPSSTVNSVNIILQSHHGFDAADRFLMAPGPAKPLTLASPICYSKKLCMNYDTNSSLYPQCTTGSQPVELLHSNIWQHRR